MVTLTPSQARANLPDVLARVLEGEEIGIECNGRVVELRPAFEDATAEYGPSADKMDAAFKRISTEIDEEKRTGKLTKL